MKEIVEKVDGKYFIRGIGEVTDPKMIEIAELMLNPPIYIKDFRPRSHKKMAENFTVRPFDTFTIIQRRGVISDSIEIMVTNTETKEAFRLGMANRRPAWETLKKIHEMGNRHVQVQVPDEDEELYGTTLVSFEDSMPYVARFGREFN